MDSQHAALEIAVERILHDRSLTREQQDAALHEAVVQIVGTAK